MIEEKILSIIKKPTSLIEFVKDRPGHDKKYSLDSSKIQNHTGWKPKYEFDQALKETIDWYLKNDEWWKPISDENILHPQPWTVNN